MVTVSELLSNHDFQVRVLGLARTLAVQVAGYERPGEIGGERDLGEYYGMDGDDMAELSNLLDEFGADGDSISETDAACGAVAAAAWPILLDLRRSKAC